MFILNCLNLKLKIFSYLNGVEDSQDCRFCVAVNLQVLSIYLGLAVEDKKIEHYMCAALVLVS